MFNYLPFHLASPAFNLSIDAITAIYLVYVIGIFMGPLAGGFVNRVGSGITLLGGSALMILALAVTLLPSLSAIVVGLFILCAGFFTIHAAAVGGLNRRLRSGQGRANALYMLFYYIGGWVGISLSGLIYDAVGWQGMILFCLSLLSLPIIAGIGELRDSSSKS
jgi:YNFM family putative membrane transporter